MSTLLMLKDKPVLKIENYICEILDFEHLPISLRYKDVNYDDVIHSWCYTRAMDIGKTNNRQILQACGLKDNNPYIVAKAFHFVTLGDCYWMKDTTEDITWNDVSLFQNSFDKAVSFSAINGRLPENFIASHRKVHSPDPMTRGMAPKTWIRDKDKIWLVKIGKKETIADEILSYFHIRHLNYKKLPYKEALQYVSKDTYEKLYIEGEALVKCPILTSEDTAMVSFEDFSIYCDRYNINPYDWMSAHYPKEYAEMQVMDYLLANNDRHEENWALYMDNTSGKIVGFLPLYDHDQIMSTDPLISQTIEEIGVPMIDTLDEPLLLLGEEFMNKLSDSQYLFSICTGFSERVQDLLDRQKEIEIADYNGDM